MIQSLISKYNKAIPRYTSYPPVPQWNNAVMSQKTWLSVLNKDIRIAEDKSLSIYIHLPFCESLCTYCGCNKRITRRHEMEHPYIEAVKKEWTIYKNSFNHKPELKYLHLGGGTPTFFSPDNLKNLISHILKDVEVVQDHSFSFEGHPNNTTYQHLSTLKELGFNRVSYGVQDFTFEVQKAIHRIQPEENVERVVRDARSLGYESVNFDLVYGLPFQTKESIATTIEKVAEYKPERIALYSYAHVPWVSKSQRGYDESNLPAPEEKLSFYLFAKDQLLDLGYEQIGMDHFALPSDELAIAKKLGKLNRNFMGYTTDNSKQMIGLGCSSISSSEHAFVQNEKSVEAYQESINNHKLPIIKGHLMNFQEVETSEIISKLICNGFYDFQDKVERLDEARANLKPLEDDNLLIIEGNTLNVTELGMLFIRNICVVFDPYLADNKLTEKKVFSQSV